MKNVGVVNGEGDWAAYLPGYAVHQTRLQTSRWLWHDGHLYVIDGTGTVRVDGAIWGAISDCAGDFTSHDTLSKLPSRMLARLVSLFYSPIAHFINILLVLDAKHAGR